MPGAPVRGLAPARSRRRRLGAASGRVTTSQTGRFTYLARRGPARTIRFRYPGTPMIRGRNGDVALRVRAATTLRPNRRSVINGEYVTFRGRLQGGWIPPAGALVELQVRTRGQWRTFAQPRATRQDRPLGLPLPLRDRPRPRQLQIPRPRAPPARPPVHDRQLARRPRPRPRPMTVTAVCTATPGRAGLSCGQGCTNR